MIWYEYEYEYEYMNMNMNVIWMWYEYDMIWYVYEWLSKPGGHVENTLGILCIGLISKSFWGICVGDLSLTE